MTKVSVFGEEPKKERKPIELCKFLNGETFEDSKENPNPLAEVTLLEKDYFCCGYDLIWCFYEWGDGIAYLGHWNDGFVE